MVLQPRNEPAARIRPYEPRDREEVRAISLSTAYGGGGEGILDAELFLDLMVRAYTDFAAGSVWVAEQAGMKSAERVVGYLAGAFDERRFHDAIVDLGRPPVSHAAAAGD